MHLFLLWNFHANLRIPISSDCIQTDYSRKNFSIELKTVLYAWYCKQYSENNFVHKMQYLGKSDSHK